MIEWLQQNLLAAYGAVVGTLALVLNLSGFLHNVRKETVRLRVLCQPHAQLKSSIATVAQSAPDKALDRRTLFEAYTVTVFNDGSVPAHLHDVGVTCRDGRIVGALVSRPSSNHWILSAIADAALEPIAPKSSQPFTVYFRVDEPTFIPKTAFVIDKTGKRWHSKARLRGASGGA